MRTDVVRSARSSPDLVRDSIGWDVSTFARALQFCSDHSRLPPTGEALEIGADGENGGLSLWLAAQGWTVTCSGLGDPPPTMVAAHRRHGVADDVRYARLDVLHLPPAPRYHLVVLKSVLGHVGQGGHFDLQQEAIARLHGVLRPGGELWLLENCAGTRLHQLVRSRLGAGRFGWRYVHLDELPDLLAPFAAFEHTSFGVVGAGARREWQRALLGRVDRAALERVTPPGWRYVVAAVATRGA